MSIEAKIIADSVSPDNVRITTMQLHYPRMFHSEFMTHRLFSRNASSSRAIPVAKLIKDMEEDEVFPLHWGANQKGMQADEEMNESVRINLKDFNFINGDDLCVYSKKHGSYHYTEDVSREDAWRIARGFAIGVAKGFDEAGYHKQFVNRLTENFGHINVVVTSTQWSNFQALRNHKDALPDIEKLAQVMQEAHDQSTPKQLKHGEWHLPYITEDESQLSLEDKIKVSVARCARVSYKTRDGRKSNIENDIKLYDRLLSSEPLHASPAEHQARPDIFLGDNYRHNTSKDRKIYVLNPETGKEEEHLLKKQIWLNPDLHGNFEGWVQYRKTLLNECQ